MWIIAVSKYYYWLLQWVLRCGPCNNFCKLHTFVCELSFSNPHLLWHNFCFLYIYLLLFRWFCNFLERCWVMQVGKLMHYISRFLVGFIIGFIRVWQISLVTLSVLPLIALAGGFYAYIATGLIINVRKSYVDASQIAQEVSFCCYRKPKQYEQKIAKWEFIRVVWS